MIGLDRFRGKLKLYATAVLEAQSKLHGLLQDLACTSAVLLDGSNSKEVLDNGELKTQHVTNDATYDVKAQNVIDDSKYHFVTQTFKKVEEKHDKYCDVVNDGKCDDGKEEQDVYKLRKDDKSNENNGNGVFQKRSPSVSDVTGCGLQAEATTKSIPKYSALLPESRQFATRFSESSTPSSSTLYSLSVSLLAEPKAEFSGPPLLHNINDSYENSPENDVSISHQITTSSAQVIPSAQTQSFQVSLRNGMESSGASIVEPCLEKIHKCGETPSVHHIEPAAAWKKAAERCKENEGKVNANHLDVTESKLELRILKKKEKMSRKVEKLDIESVTGRYLNASSAFSKLTNLLNDRRKSKFLVDAKIDRLKRQLSKLKVAFIIEKNKTPEKANATESKYQRLVEPSLLHTFEQEVPKSNPFNCHLNYSPPLLSNYRTTKNSQLQDVATLKIPLTLVNCLSDNNSEHHTPNPEHGLATKLCDEGVIDLSAKVQEQSKMYGTLHQGLKSSTHLSCDKHEQLDNICTQISRNEFGETRKEVNEICNKKAKRRGRNSHLKGIEQQTPSIDNDSLNKIIFNVSSDDICCLLNSDRGETRELSQKSHSTLVGRKRLRDPEREQTDDIPDSTVEINRDLTLARHCKSSTLIETQEAGFRHVDQNFDGFVQPSYFTVSCEGAPSSQSTPYANEKTSAGKVHQQVSDKLRNSEGTDASRFQLTGSRFQLTASSETNRKRKIAPFDSDEYLPTSRLSKSYAQTAPKKKKVPTATLR